MKTHKVCFAIYLTCVYLLDPDDRRRFCISIGCDYLDNIKGVGFKTSLGAFKSKNGMSAFKKILEKRDMKKEELKEYFEKIEKVLIAFKHQLVYDPETEKIVPLFEAETPAEKKLLKCQEAEYYTGKVILEAKKFCNGELDFLTEQPRTPSTRDFGKLIRFFDWKPQDAPGFLRNLCKRPVTFDNFEDYEVTERQKCIDGISSSEGTDCEQSDDDQIIKKHDDNMTISTTISPCKKIKKDSTTKKFEPTSARRKNRATVL